MTPQLLDLSYSARVAKLRKMVDAVRNFLNFAEQDVDDDINVFFQKLSNHHRILSELAGEGKFAVEHSSVDDKIGQSLEKLTNGILRYLSFVTIPETEDFQSWVIRMNANVENLAAVYDEVSPLFVRKD